MHPRTAGSNISSLLVLAILCAGLLLLPLVLRTEPVQSSVPADESLLRWLEEGSMLYQSRQIATTLSGRGAQWHHTYGSPQPLEAVRRASVWLLDYPGSVIPRPGRSVLATWGDPALWDHLRDIGIDLLHTGPLNRAGGVEGRRYLPTLDGWFDPISLGLDPALGTEEEYARLVEVAGKRGGKIAGDLVPLHTGTGPDFHLALRRYRDYPGLYTMVEIAREDWPLLPRVESSWDVALLPKDAARQLTRKGYLPGLINSCDAAPEARSWSGWSASGEVAGVDGKARRWVYLHYFKPRQPALNWLDPSFAAQRAVGGSVVRGVYQRGAAVMRLDAVPFLGIEPKPGSQQESLHYQHPLSVSATNYLAMMIRKLGGHSFHELNVPLESLKNFTRDGPDLSYDFFTRAQLLHALLTQDASALRLAYRWLHEARVPLVSLVHDLQNHDEITYQLVELDHRKDDVLPLADKKLTGGKLRERMLEEMRERVAGKAAPYNKLYRPERDGVATTFAGFIAPALGIADPYRATSEQLSRIQQGHLLLTAANALQPGVFSLSSWDLVGALPVPEDAVKQWMAEGDMRWVNRGGVDLLGANAAAKASPFGLVRAKALYGSLPEQLARPDSFVSQLRHLLAVRRKLRIAEGELLAVPEPKERGLCLLGLRLPGGKLALTVLNFSQKEVREVVDVKELLTQAKQPAGGHDWADALTGKVAGRMEEQRKLQVQVAGLTGTVLLLRQKEK